MLAALELLSTASFTSTFTEKQHAPTAQVKEFHPDASDDVIMAGALTHTFYQVLPGKPTGVEVEGQSSLEGEKAAQWQASVHHWPTALFL